MRKKVLAGGAAILFGLGSAAGCNSESEPYSGSKVVAPSSEASSPSEQPSQPGMRVVCKELVLGRIVLSPKDQARFMSGDQAEQQKVRTVLRGTSVPHMMYVAVHSRKELTDNAPHDARVVGAIAHLVAPKVHPLAQNAEYNVTDQPDVVKSGYLEVIGTTVECTRPPEQEVLPPSSQPVDPTPTMNPLA